MAEGFPFKVLRNLRDAPPLHVDLGLTSKPAFAFALARHLARSRAAWATPAL